MANVSPLTSFPAAALISSQSASVQSNVIRLAAPDTSIKAAAVHMVYANRTSLDFITPSRVSELEFWTSKVIVLILG